MVEVVQFSSPWWLFFAGFLHVSHTEGVSAQKSELVFQRFFPFFPLCSFSPLPPPVVFKDSASIPPPV